MTPPAIPRRAFLFAALAAPLARAQDATFSTEVSVVNVLASVRDKQGRLLADLTQDEFTLTENGVVRPIRYFSRETDLPLTLGLLVDTSLSQRNVLEDEKLASSRFINRVLREDKDRTFLIHFDHEAELLQDFTSSKAALARAMESVRIAEGPRLVRRGPNGSAPRRDGSGDRYPVPGNGSGRPAGTVLFDSIYLAGDELLRHETGRKAIILLTDGVDQGSRVTMQNAIESAHRADLVVYSILFADEEAYGLPQVFSRGGRIGRGRGMGPTITFPRQMERSDGRKILQRISKETGGSFFEVSKKLPLDEVYRRLEEELRSQYSLGFTPTAAQDGRFRDIALTVKRRDAVVQAREGYYPVR